MTVKIIDYFNQREMSKGGAFELKHHRYRVEVKHQIGGVIEEARLNQREFDCSWELIQKRNSDEATQKVLNLPNQRMAESSQKDSKEILSFIEIVSA